MKRFFSKIVDVRPDEVRALWLGFIFFFVVLAGYYVIRPVRDNIGATQFENLWWMFTVVLVTMIGANALFSMIVARMSRRRFIPIAYRFFILNLLIFFVLMQFMPPGKQRWVDGCFFVWVSVFNLFATAVFWGFMTDIFTSEQGKRLFGFIAVGGSLGGILGPIITTSLVHHVSTGVLLLICAGMLEIAAQSVRFFPSDFRRHDSKSAEDENAEKPIGGKFWDGVTNICKSPYLFGLFVFILLYTLNSTWAYFQQAELTKAGFVDRAAPTAFFAKLDLSVNTLARKACMSPSHFNRAFKSVFGSAPAEFVENLRINEAKRCLAVPKRTLEIIAASVGFSDAQTFRRAFERRLGAKPRSYLKNFNAGPMAASANGEAALPRTGRVPGTPEAVAVPTQG